MTIRTKEAAVPSEFPPARLYIDDIEEIVRIFQELVDSRKFSEHFTAEELKLRVRLSIGNRECDDVQDLPKISSKPRTRELNIRVDRGGWIETSLRISPFGSYWRSSGFTKESAWQAFHKLQPVFKERNAHWKTFVHSLPSWFALSWGFFALALFAFLRFLLKQEMPPTPAFAISVVVVGILVVALAMGVFPHTTVILRHSSEPAPLGKDLPQKILLVGISSVLTFLLTLLGFYLKHKYLP